MGRETWTEWGLLSKQHMEARTVAPVSEGRDDQPGSVAEVLPPVRLHCVQDLHGQPWEAIQGLRLQRRRCREGGEARGGGGSDRRFLLSTGDAKAEVAARVLVLGLRPSSPC